MLEEIKRLVLERLAGLPGEFYPAIDVALGAIAVGGDGTHSPQLVYQSQSALWVLRQHHAAHVMRFRQRIAQGFDDFRLLHARDSVDVPLGLIDEGQIDFHLAGQALAASLDHRHSASLDMMGARLDILAGALGAEPSMNPLGPTRLAMAFVDTFEDEQIPELLRTQLFEHYGKALEGVLGELYDAANTLLARGGYGLPAADIPAAAGSPGPRGQSGGTTQQPGPVPAGGSSGGAGAGGWGSTADRYQSGQPGDSVSGSGQHGHGGFGYGDSGQGQGQGGWGGAGRAGSSGVDTPSPAELTELRSMLHAWREGRRGEAAAPASAPGSAPAESGGRRQLRLDELVNVASLMQAEPADVFARALAGSGNLAGAIREQLNTGSRRLGLDPEQISFSAEDEDAIDLVGLLFDALFSSQQLQDRARRMYARLVLPYVKVALTDQQLFVSPTHPARRLFDAITEAVAGNPGNTPQERELLDRATSISQRVVAEYTEDLVIFETAHRELDALLQQQRRRIELQEERAAKATNGRERLNHAREQADTVLARRLSAPPLSPAIAEFLRGSWRHHLVQTWLRDGDDRERLVEAVSLGDALVAADRLAAEGRGAELADHLLALEPRIAECLASSGLDQTAAEHALALLVKGLVYPHTPRDLYPPPPRQEEDDDEERRLWLDPRGAARAKAAQVEELRALEAGSWLQISDLKGESLAAKIAWVSPLSNRRLLVNRRGLRVLVATVEELAVMEASGRLKVGCEPTAFEQAMQHVREQLDRAAGAVDR
ncbi:Thymidine phosphorylase [Lysobacter sp. A03]|nr:Thymidine phosphorylase [Lysobacter sp. A03]